MAPRLSKLHGDQIDAAFYENPHLSNQELALWFDCNIRSIQRRKKNLKKRLEDSWDPRKKPGRKAKVTPSIIEYAEELVDRYKTIYLDELGDFIYIDFGVQLDLPQLSRLLATARISHKKATTNDDLIKA
ncbi:hypothetical protein ACEPPN_015259 [Leptodophora sp. 'Broadleaf-Isolate-01']